MKALALLVIIVVVAAVVGDVAAKQVAENRIASQVEDSIEGVSGVEAEIDAFPFLPTLLSGELDGLRMKIARVRSGGLAVSDLALELRALDFDPVDVFAGDGAITVGGGKGRAFASAAAISRALQRAGADATVAFDGTNATVSSQGQTVSVETVQVSDGALVFDLPTGPLTLQIPETFESLTYESARVEGGRLRIGIALSGKRFEL
ncbi:MAG: DUF2993 domain-containing protein [Actinomycetota bacterium]